MTTIKKVGNDKKKWATIKTVGKTVCNDKNSGQQNQCAMTKTVGNNKNGNTGPDVVSLH